MFKWWTNFIDKYFPVGSNPDMRRQCKCHRTYPLLLDLTCAMCNHKPKEDTYMEESQKR